MEQGNMKAENREREVSRQHLPESWGASITPLHETKSIWRFSDKSLRHFWLLCNGRISVPIRFLLFAKKKRSAHTLLEMAEAITPPYQHRKRSSVLFWDRRAFRLSW